MDEYNRFCTTCGKAVDPEATFCPACGASLTEQSAPESGSTVSSPAGAQWKAFEDRYAEEKFKLSMLLLFIGAAVTLLSGIYVVAAMDSLVEMMIEMYDSMNMTASEDSIRSMLLISGYISIVCGIMCTIAGMLVRMRKNWTVTIVFAFIATIFGFPASMLGGILGLLVCWYLYKFKDQFEIQPRNNGI